jgi:hydroxymethylpyrimidine pyrophosphatase-like HAD family hydrolase
MIKLFVTDLDGCISYPFRSPKWEAIQEIRALNILSRSEKPVPPLSICTGRPHPYAEAVAQWLDIRLPFVFESAGLYHWEGNRIETALGSHDGVLDPIRELKEWLKTDLLPQFPTAILEHSKMMDAGIVAPERAVIDEALPVIRQKVEGGYPGLEIHVTDVSVNILMPGNNKLQGMKLLAKTLDISLDDIAYIGDTGGDIKALENVKMPFSPKNATRGVKNVSINLDLETTDAVLEAYRRIIEHNEGLG